jgi:hypothetical protein
MVEFKWNQMTCGKVQLAQINHGRTQLNQRDCDKP